MLRNDAGLAGVDGLISPGQVASIALDALCEKKFMALPHERGLNIGSLKSKITNGGLRECKSSMTANTPKGLQAADQLLPLAS